MDKKDQKNTYIIKVIFIVAILFFCIADIFLHPKRYRKDTYETAKQEESIIETATEPPDTEETNDIATKSEIDRTVRKNIKYYEYEKGDGYTTVSLQIPEYDHEWVIDRIENADIELYTEINTDGQGCKVKITGEPNNRFLLMLDYIDSETKEKHGSARIEGIADESGNIENVNIIITE